MKDQIFEGKDVAEAVAAACRALAVDEAALRYVVLERGTPGALGMRGAPARIAVMLAAGAGAAARGPARQEPSVPAPDTPRAAVEVVMAALAQAAGVDVAVQVEETPDALVVRLEGAGCAFFLEEEGEVLEAVEHLLQRVNARHPETPRLSLECQGHRERREEALRAMARELAAAVRADGRPRATRPLNSYERRIVHLAVSEEVGLKTFSVGEGSERRVTVAPAGFDPAASDDDRG